VAVNHPVGSSSLSRGARELSKSLSSFFYKKKLSSGC
jgi:hypothetical protein